MGDNPYGTFPSTREVMRGDRGTPRGGWDRPDPRQHRGERFGGGPFPDQSRTPWRDRYEPDDPQARERMADAYGISDVGQLDAQSWQQEGEGMGGAMQDNMQRRAASSRWTDAGGRYPESERPGAGGRVAGWAGDDWNRSGYGQPHGRDASYEQFTSSPMRSQWGQSSPGTGSRRVAPKGYRRSDERIQEDLCERLAHDHRLDVEHVEVKVREGVVTLSGTVRDRQQKFYIEDLADDTFGVTEVENQIRVDREGSRSGGKVPQLGVSHETRPDDSHISGVSSAGANTGSTASSYAGGMEVGAGEVPRGTDPYGGSTKPTERST
ncbi:BON domain-containing protein [Cupriavidus sp. AU9028]|nr:BON domain-containing protein [Cupriavidus sp. AU9028]